jgi:hypothetical protein
MARRSDRNKSKNKNKPKKTEPKKPSASELYWQEIFAALANRKVIQSEVSFVADFSAVSYDRGSGSAIERFPYQVRSVLTEYVDTSRPARETPVYSAGRRSDGQVASPGEYFLLAGQVSSPDAAEWVPAVYQSGARVSYLGEIYYAIGQTDTEPPVTIKTISNPDGSYSYHREENTQSWVLIGKEGSVTSASQRLVNPDFGFVNGQWQYGTQGDTWLVSVDPGKSEIFIWDFAGQTKTLKPNTTYAIDPVENAPSWMGGNEVNGVIAFPKGTTFTTNPSLTPPYTTSQPCSAQTKGGVITSVIIRTLAYFDEGALGLGGGNGIYIYQGPDLPLKRLNAGDGAMKAPRTYRFLAVNEYNGPPNIQRDTWNVSCDDPLAVNRPWISDNTGNWSPAEPSVAVGKSYGFSDIPCVNWRGKDSVVSAPLEEWDPSKVYYPNDMVTFGGSAFQLLTSDQSGVAGAAPIDSGLWGTIQAPGADFSSFVDAYRVNTIFVENFLSEARFNCLVAPEKTINIYSDVPKQMKVSIGVSGDSTTVYATNSTATSVFSSTIYNSPSPLEFTLSAPNIEVFKVRWDFGDGSTSTELTPTHSYQVGSSMPVPFKVSVLVTDTKGRFYRSTRMISLQKMETALLGTPVVVD